MYYKEFIVQSDWMHHGEGLQLFNRMGLSVPTDAEISGSARGGSPGSTWARIRKRPTTTRRTRSSAACRTAAAGRCCARPRRSTGSAIRSTSKDFDAAARRVDVRAVPRALPGIRRRRRRPLPQSGRHDAADERVPAGRRAEVQEVARRVHGRLARSDEAERRHHPQLRRSRRHGSAAPKASGGGTPTAGDSARSIR